jgi:integrase
MAKRLTAATLKQAPPKSGQREIADSVCTGLFLRLGVGGTQTFVLRGRVKGQAQPIRVTVGDARRIELTDARARAEELREKMLRGTDPRHEESAEWSEVVGQFIEKHAQRRGNRTWAQTQAILDNKVTPHWGGKLVGEITPEDVKALLSRIEDDGSVYQVNRTLAAVRKLFAWAATRGLLKASPVPPGLAREGEVKRDRYLSFDEIAAVWRAAERLGGPMGSLVKMLLVAGQRQGETAAMRWDGVDLEGRTWLLTAAETKAKRRHVVPLSDLALEVIKGQPLIGDPAEFVFTTTGKSPLSGFSKAKVALDKAIKAETGVALAPWRFHDLRRTAATYMEGALGIGFHIVGDVLNHSHGALKGVTARYTQGDLEFERRLALTAWARLLALIVEGGEIWAKVKVILNPLSDDDRARVLEFRRFAQGSDEMWGRYVEGLTAAEADNVARLRASA